MTDKYFEAFFDQLKLFTNGDVDIYSVILMLKGICALSWDDISDEDFRRMCIFIKWLEEYKQTIMGGDQPPEEK